MRENKFQAHVVKRLRAEHRGCVVVKNDSAYLQGIPDLSFYIGRFWGMLEVKADLLAPLQPNQQYYVNLFNFMSFCRIICPQNEEEVFDEIQRALAGFDR